MAFSLPQQLRYFRPMVDKAWRAHCDRECITDSTRASKDEWYRKQLVECLGVPTTKRCNKGKDFDTAMAHFEALADDGIFWQTKSLNGNAVRARFLLQEVIKNLRLTDEYVTTIREQMGIPAVLRCLNVEQAVRLRVALLYHLRRKQDRIVETPPT